MLTSSDDFVPPEPRSAQEEASMMWAALTVAEDGERPMHLPRTALSLSPLGLHLRVVESDFTVNVYFEDMEQIDVLPELGQVVIATPPPNPTAPSGREYVVLVADAVLTRQLGDVLEFKMLEHRELKRERQEATLWRSASGFESGRRSRAKSFALNDSRQGSPSRSRFNAASSQRRSRVRGGPELRRLGDIEGSPSSGNDDATASDGPPSLRASPVQRRAAAHDVSHAALGGQRVAWEGARWVSTGDASPTASEYAAPVPAPVWRSGPRERQSLRPPAPDSRPPPSEGPGATGAISEDMSMTSARRTMVLPAAPPREGSLHHQEQQHAAAGGAPARRGLEPVPESAPAPLPPGWLLARKAAALDEHDRRLHEESAPPHRHVGAFGHHNQEQQHPSVVRRLHIPPPPPPHSGVHERSPSASARTGSPRPVSPGKPKRRFVFDGPPPFMFEQGQTSTLSGEPLPSPAGPAPPSRLNLPPPSAAGMTPSETAAGGDRLPAATPSEQGTRASAPPATPGSKRQPPPPPQRQPEATPSEPAAPKSADVKPSSARQPQSAPTPVPAAANAGAAPAQPATKTKALPPPPPPKTPPAESPAAASPAAAAAGPAAGADRLPGNRPAPRTGPRSAASPASSPRPGSPRPKGPAKRPPAEQQAQPTPVAQPRPAKKSTPAPAGPGGKPAWATAPSNNQPATHPAAKTPGSGRPPPPPGFGSRA